MLTLESYFSLTIENKMINKNVGFVVWVGTWNSPKYGYILRIGINFIDVNFNGEKFGTRCSMEELNWPPLLFK